MRLRRLLARIRRASPKLAPVALLFALGSCHDSPTGGGERGTASGGLALSLSVAGASQQQAPGLGRAFDRVDRIRVSVFRSEEVVIDTTFALSPSGSDTALRLPITLTAQQQQTQSFGVIVELLRAEQRLFQGSGTASLLPGKTTQVEVVLNPVAGDVAVPATLPTLTAPGDSLQLGGAVVFATGDTIPDLALTWSTPDSAVARVHANGYAVAVGEGVATLAGRYGGFSRTVQLNVQYEIGSISVAPIMVMGLVPDSAVQLTATVRDAHGNPLPRPVTWLAADTTVATVDSTGLLRGRRPGTTSVTASSGEKSAEIPITVQARAVTRVAVSPASTTLILGDSVALTAAGYAENGSLLTGRAVAWSSASAAIATVSAGGVVRGKRAGTTRIYAVVEGVRDSARIDVVGPPAVGDSTTVDSLTTSSAIVRGSARPGNGATVVAMRWGTGAALENLAPTVELSADTLAHALRFALGDLTPGTTYHYRIEATNAAGRDSTVGSFTTLDAAPPPPPALNAVPTGESIYLSWQPSSRATSYRIERSTDGSPTWSTLATVGTDSLKYVIKWDGTGIHDYAFRVLACREIGCSLPTDTVQASLDAIVRASAAVVGRQHSCALQPVSGEILCWGANDLHQISSSGSSAVGQAFHPQLGTKYVQIAAGYNRTCGLLADGRTYCWGAWSNVPGIDATPQLVPGGIKFTTISVGVDHACGVTAAGAAYCWGSNHSYQLARPDSTYRTSTPVLVPGGLTFRSISAGFDQTCGVTTANKAYCWGWNGSGQLGIDDSDALHTHVDAPFAVAGGHSFATVSAGDQSTCGITTSNQAFCWGDNGAGQLGTDGPSIERTPTPVVNGLGFTSISAGSGYTCGLRTGGQAYCWGANEVGGLGTGSSGSTYTPAPVAGGHTFTSVTAKFDHTCGIEANQQLYCWGANSSYQVGDGTSVNRNAPVNVRFSVPVFMP